MGVATPIRSFCATSRFRDVAVMSRVDGLTRVLPFAAKNDMGNSLYPCVPGHEAAGIVRAVGSK
eukprot:scaffold27943_cov54-Prasinocladus_malaysianus.AAC.1